jgi:hypothetical protein
MCHSPRIKKARCAVTPVAHAKKNLWYDNIIGNTEKKREE